MSMHRTNKAGHVGNVNAKWFKNNVEHQRARKRMAKASKRRNRS